MFNKIKHSTLAVKNHVTSHKAAYAASTIAIAAIALQQKNLKDFTSFLEEKGIDPLEFYCPEVLAEMAETTL